MLIKRWRSSTIELSPTMLAITGMAVAALSGCSKASGTSSNPAARDPMTDAGTMTPIPDSGATTPVPDSGVDTGSMTPLQRVAAIVIPNCAVAGCHDAATKSHGMDLSSAEKIRDTWVGQLGFDHCTGTERPRVVPGDPPGSFVIAKVEGTAACAPLAERMPPPPRAALTTEQISIIRAWIQAGAPSDAAVPPDAGATSDASSDAGTSDAGTSDDAGPPTCSPSKPCDPGLTCTGTTCGGPWECVVHFDPLNEHPCSEEMVQFCGCDGTNFTASVTCPDRPWLHVGACEDGFSCTAGMIECAAPQPECPAGQYPSVSNGCWGPCVPVASCRCLYHWMCPDLAANTCLVDTYRCGPNPNLVDAGSDAGP